MLIFALKKNIKNLNVKHLSENSSNVKLILITHLHYINYSNWQYRLHGELLLNRYCTFSPPIMLCGITVKSLPPAADSLQQYSAVFLILQLLTSMMLSRNLGSLVLKDCTKFFYLSFILKR